MFFLNSQLKKTINLINNTSSIFSFGKFWINWLSLVLRITTKELKKRTPMQSLIIFKYLVWNIFLTSELNKDLNSLSIQKLKTLQTYWGLWHSLSLPCNGQRTWTNASTQRKLSNNPRRRHFIQKKNWRKFNPKK